MDLEETKRRLFAKLDNIKADTGMRRNIPVIQFSRDVADADLERIRHDAGNPDLSSDDIVIFGKSMIARTDVTANKTRFTRDALQAAAPSFIGKPINFDHEYREAAKQIGRIYDAFTEDKGNTTFLYVKAYAIKTESDADLQKKLLNRQHREQSMGVDILKAHCSACSTDVMKSQGICPQHPDGDITVTECIGNHVSYVGDPAVEGAGLVTNSKGNVVNDRGPDDTDQTDRLHRLAKDGEYFRLQVSQEFSKWLTYNNPTLSRADVETLIDKLSAKEMMTFARIEKERAIEDMPDGKQQSEVPETDGEPDLADRPYKTIKDIYRS